MAKSTDPWHFARPQLARSYLEALLAAPRRPISIFGPRQTGKTTLLTTDLAGAAEQEGLVPIYVDLWAQRQPIMAVGTRLANHVLDISRRPSRTIVTAVEAFGVSASFAPPARAGTQPDSAGQLHNVYAELRRLLGKKRVLLMLDEIQSIAEQPQSEENLRALRALFNQNAEQLLVIMTGSSREKLLKLFSDKGQATFGFARQVDFEPLGEEFIEFVAERFNRSSGRSLNERELGEAFEQLHYRPGDLIDLVQELLIGARTNIRDAIPGFLESRYPEERHSERWAALTPLQRAVFVRAASGRQAYFSAGALKEYGGTLGLDKTTKVPPSSVAVALEALVRQQLLSSTGTRGEYRIDDEYFAGWVNRSVPPAGSKKSR
ncbi:MAG: AAA family ATPase [Burkholderiales bacterium]